jgi:hypothetical protein
MHPSTQTDTDIMAALEANSRTFFLPISRLPEVLAVAGDADAWASR